MICSALDWDLAAVVPHDYIQYLLPFENQAQIRSHVYILLSIAICGKSIIFSHAKHTHTQLFLFRTEYINNSSEPSHLCMY